jgi:hypothetical protein
VSILTYLVFDTQVEAQTALTQIWSNMQPIVEVNAKTMLPVPTPVTTAWSIEQQRLDGKWCFLKPDIEHMTNVVDYVEEEYSESWFTSE